MSNIKFNKIYLKQGHEKLGGINYGSKYIDAKYQLQNNRKNGCWVWWIYPVYDGVRTGQYQNLQISSKTVLLA